MSFTGIFKRKITIAASSFFLVFMLGVMAAFLSSCSRGNSGPEVISKRVKLNMPEGAAQQQAKTDQKPAVENMPDVKADLPVKDVTKPDTVKPAIKVEIPEKKEPEAAKVQKTAPNLKASEKHKKSKTSVSSSSGKNARKIIKTAENGKARLVKKTVHKRYLLKKAKLRPWAVNVASFPRNGDARKLIVALRSAGYNCYKTEFTKNGLKWHRVRVGFYHTRAEAQRTGKRIEARFHVRSSWVVEPAMEEMLEHIK